MMNVLRDGRSERGTARVGKRHDLKTVRWYVLTLPTTGVARCDRISPAKSLDAELSRRKRRGETLFEYFAPSYVEVRKVDGKMVNTKRPLLFNYVFVRSSVEEIFQMKRTLPLYNFLPRVSSGGMTHFPYLSDDEMGNLRWVAESYSNELPVYVPDSDRLLKGDRVRITSGYFTGMEAEVVIQPGGGHKDVMARILDCMWVPLLEVKPGEYELIELNTKGKHVYTHLDNDRLREGLHDALGRYHASGNVSEEDTRLAREVLRSYGSLRAETDVMRCKIYSLLLSAYQLRRAFPDSEVTPMRLLGYPFPVVMVSVTDRSLRAYARRHILRKDDKDYKQLTVPEFSLADYRGWHKREVEGLPLLSETV